MMQTIEQERLISHRVSPENFDAIMQKRIEKIRQQGDKPHVTVARQLDLLSQLVQFDFGRYLLQNQGLNGYWTDYMLTHPWFGRKTSKNNRNEPLSEMESFILNRAPAMLATQQRFEIFLRENQKQVRDNASLCCLPCGKMGELLYLKYDNINNIRLVGIDYDATTFNDAKMLAEEKHLTKYIEFIQQDAWNLDNKNEFDLISCNGLNVYEPDNQKIAELYRLFHEALKPNGILAVSFLTWPPTLAKHCEWDMSKVNQEDLQLQRIIFTDILQVHWQCFRSTEETNDQLKYAGFTDIHYIYDEARMYPTAIARRLA